MHFQKHRVTEYQFTTALPSSRSTSVPTTTTMAGGVTVPVSQSSDRIDLLLKKIQELEVENLTNKTRLEDFKKIKPDHDAFNRGEEIIPAQSNLRSEKEQSIKCKLCKETFSKNCELEKHTVTIHDSEKTHACETCGKTFVLKWRLKKHLGIHQGSVKSCKFFKEGKECPFEDIGCKFDHVNKEMNTDKVVTVRDKTTTVKSTAPTVEVNNIFDSTKNNVKKVAEERDNEEAVKMLAEGGDNTGNDANKKSQAFFDLDNPHVYPPIVYPQNTRTVYHQNPQIVYHPHIVYPQNHQTTTAGTSLQAMLSEHHQYYSSFAS